MLNFKIILNGEEYQIVQNPEAPFLFKVFHKSGLHNIGKHKTTNEWKFVDHKVGTEPIDLDAIGGIIDSELEKPNMKKIKIVHPDTATSVAASVGFSYPDGELSDFEQVEIIPVTADGTQILPSAVRTVVQVGQADEKGNGFFQAEIHVIPRTD